MLSITLKAFYVQPGRWGNAEALQIGWQLYLKDNSTLHRPDKFYSSYEQIN